MKKFEKNYVGKGNKVEGLNIVKITCKLSDLVKFAYKYNEVDYVSIEIAKLQTPDQFGHEYTAWVSSLVESAPKMAPKEAEKPKKNRKSSKLATDTKTVEEVSKDLPF
jgi:hypothetical protein